MPKGVGTGVQLETVLRELSKAKGHYRFDALPIPFRAVATDLVTGKAVVFSDGEIANVMRASMSVPGAVAPAEFDGMMLVDGMLTSNLPVETARAMGADIVIAVNVGTPLLKREELNSILIVSKKHALNASPEDFDSGRALVGTGPYRLVHYLRGDRLELARHDGWWGKRPAWDKVTLRVVPADPSRTAALLAGELDVIEQSPPPSALRSRSSAGRN